MVRLSDLRGRPIVLNFWAGLCPPCRAEMPNLQAFYEKFGDQVTLLGLDVGPFTGLGSNQNGEEPAGGSGGHLPGGIHRVWGSSKGI